MKSMMNRKQAPTACHTRRLGAILALRAWSARRTNRTFGRAITRFAALLRDAFATQAEVQFSHKELARRLGCCRRAVSFAVAGATRAGLCDVVITWTADPSAPRGYRQSATTYRPGPRLTRLQRGDRP